MKDFDIWQKVGTVKAKNKQRGREKFRKGNYLETRFPGEPRIEEEN